ncbi:hypothetical protein MJC1_04142 [Methylocystis sp. MJC1]|jgi:hypothetical protein|nr:hypothetical protein MJC1_04142 [Methylocystis sp. MJC1]
MRLALAQSGPSIVVSKPREIERLGRGVFAFGFSARALTTDAVWNSPFPQQGHPRGGSPCKRVDRPVDIYGSFPALCGSTAVKGATGRELECENPALTLLTSKVGTLTFVADRALTGLAGGLFPAAELAAHGPFERNATRLYFSSAARYAAIASSNFWVPLFRQPSARSALPRLFCVAAKPRGTATVGKAASHCSWPQRMATPNASASQSALKWGAPKRDPFAMRVCRYRRDGGRA